MHVVRLKNTQTGKSGLVQNKIWTDGNEQIAPFCNKENVCSITKQSINLFHQVCFYTSHFVEGMAALTVCLKTVTVMCTFWLFIMTVFLK